MNNFIFIIENLILLRFIDKIIYCVLEFCTVSIWIRLIDKMALLHVLGTIE